MDGETSSKERLASDLRTLVGDAEELLKATASQAGEKIGVARIRARITSFDVVDAHVVELRRHAQLILEGK